MCQAPHWVALLVVVAGAHGGPNPPRNAPQISAEASVIKGEKDTESLQIRLANGGSDVEVAVANLPWMHWHSMTIVAMKVVAGRGVPISMDPIIDDPAFGTSVIKSKQTVKGDLPLRHLYSKWEQLRGESDIILFWSYQLETRGGESSNRVGGWMELKKR